MIKEIKNVEFKAPSLCLCVEHIAAMDDSLTKNEMGEVLSALYRTLIKGEESFEFSTEKGCDAFTYVYPYTKAALNTYLRGKDTGKTGGRGNKKSVDDIDPKADRISYRETSKKK